jgi:histidine ammonia-lyase
MGMTAALKLRRIVDNVERVLAIELLAAAEGLEYRRPLKAGKGVEQGYQVLRKIAAPVLADRALTDDIENVAKAIREGAFIPL